MGRLTADPETRYTQNNISVSRFTLAVNRPGKKQEGQPSTDYFDIVAWRGTADFAGKYFKKGMQVLIEGYLRNNQWQDQQGNKRTKTEVNAENVYFADSKRNESHPDYEGSQEQPEKPFNGTMGGEDEDLPF
jgi:single-strand DNA-binding protein